MRIDLHLHAKERSNCSICSEEDIIKSAINYNLNAIAFTDHDRFIEEDRLRYLNEKYKPFKIFSGIEVSLVEQEHCVVLGVYDKKLESKDWTYDRLYKFVRANCGYIILAHPYRYKQSIGIDINKYKPDAIEVHSTNIGRDDEENIYRLIKKIGANAIFNSDAHEDYCVGIYHNNIDGIAQNEKELIKLLKNNQITCGCIEKNIKKFNKKVEEREKKIIEVIEKKQEDTFLKNRNEIWESYYNRIRMGKSYII